MLRRPLVLAALLSTPGLLAGCGDGEVAGGAGLDGGVDGGFDPSRTNGAGGVPCLEVAESGGFAYCRAEVGPLELRIVEPADTSGPMQLAVHLHGDTANGHYENWGWRRFAGWARDRRVLLVSALAPNGCSWWRRPGDVDCDMAGGDSEGANADALAEAFEALGEGYDFFHEPKLYVGFSGGALFATALMLPRHGDVHPGAWVTNCGGDQPWGAGVQWDERDPGLLAKQSVYFTYGSLDFLVDQIGRGVDYYTARGYDVDELVVPDEEHCDNDIDWTAVTIERWERHALFPGPESR